MKRRSPVHGRALSRTVVRMSVLTIPLALTSMSVLAQDHQVTFSPSLRLTETITDNVDLSRGSGTGGNASSKSDYITGIIPSKIMRSNASRPSFATPSRDGRHKTHSAGGPKRQASDLFFSTWRPR